MSRFFEASNAKFPSCTFLKPKAREDKELSFHALSLLNNKLGVERSPNLTRANSDKIIKVTHDSDRILTSSYNYVASNHLRYKYQLQYQIGDIILIRGLKANVSLYLLMKPANQIYVFKKVYKDYFELADYKNLNETINSVNKSTTSRLDFCTKTSFMEKGNASELRIEPENPIIYFNAGFEEMLDAISSNPKGCRYSNTIYDPQLINKPCKLYYRIYGIHYLHNDVQTTLTIGNSYIFSFSPFFSETESSGTILCEATIADQPNLIKIPKIRIELRRAESSKTEEFLFSINDFKITIGRSSICDIQCFDQSISKVHTTIFYCTSSRKWIILDGHENKPSSNGNWILVHTQLSCELEKGTKSFLRYGPFNVCFEYK